MSGHIPESFISELIDRIDIVELIGNRLQMKKAGREYHALCPFHNERTPSFTVSPNKQFYHCFGCGAHGSVISFLMAYEGLDFIDSIEELAKMAGIKVPRDNDHQRHDFSPLYDIIAEAKSIFCEQLNKNSEAKDYLFNRGLDEASIEKFSIGYAPHAWDHLITKLGSNPKQRELLEKAGLCSRGERGIYDKFRHRIMFPIDDKRGRTIAFGGRSIANEKGPKYLNSPETPLFHKGRQLYGLHQAKSTKTLDKILVVEGYMDVIALAQFGMSNCVATLGTATTESQAELLFRNSRSVYFCFDGDRAGRQAAWRALESILPALREGRQAFFLMLPDGEDPDTLVRQKNGLASLQQKIVAATPLSDFLFGELSNDINFQSMDQRAEFANRVSPLIEKMPDGIYRDMMLDRLRSVSQYTNIHIKPPAKAQATQKRNRQDPKRSPIRSAIAILLQHPQLIEQLGDDLDFTEDKLPGQIQLQKLIEILKSNPHLSTAAVLEFWRGDPFETHLANLATMELHDLDQPLERMLRDSLANAYKLQRKVRLDELSMKSSKNGLTGDEVQELSRLLQQKGQIN